jgi:hypothetical protein
MEEQIDLQKYFKMKLDGKDPLSIFSVTRIDGLQNFKCLMVLQEVCGMSLDEARKISYKYNGLDENGKSAKN